MRTVRRVVTAVPAACPGWGEDHPVEMDTRYVGYWNWEVCDDCADDEPWDSCAGCGGYHGVTYQC